MNIELLNKAFTVIGYITPIIIGLDLFKKKYDKRKEKQDEELRLLEIDLLKKEIESLEKKHSEVIIKLDFLDRIFDLPFFNELSNSVQRIFNFTKADRFLILIAKNGKDSFNIINVVFEQHNSNKYKINAINRYKNIEIDEDYRDILYKAERVGIVNLKTESMSESSLLKSFYEIEGVTFSRIKFLARKPIDDDNDFLIYSSLATHTSFDFTKIEDAFIKTQYEGTIKPSLEKVLN